MDCSVTSSRAARCELPEGNSLKVEKGGVPTGTSSRSACSIREVRAVLMSRIIPENKTPRNGAFFGGESRVLINQFSPEESSTGIATAGAGGASGDASWQRNFPIGSYWNYVDRTIR